MITINADRGSMAETLLTPEKSPGILQHVLTKTLGELLPAPAPHVVRLFVAGSGRSRHIIGGIIASLQDYGFYVYDWTAQPEWEQETYNHKAVAQKDLAELDQADGVIWYWDGEPSEGAPFEVGYAHGRGKPVVILKGAEHRLGSIYPCLFPLTEFRLEAAQIIERQVRQERRMWA